MTRRVAITGIGLICPLGNSPADLWESLASQRSGITPLERIPAKNLPIRCGGQCRDFTGAIGDFGELDKSQQKAVKKGSRLMCREIAMGVAAAQLALQDARPLEGFYASERSGVVFGSDYIMTAPEEFADGVRQCLDAEGREFEFERWGQEGLSKVTPLWLLKYLPNMPASHIAIYNDLRGPSNSLTHREASSNLAVGEAYATIVRGSADMMVAGATGTRLHPLRTVHVLLQEEFAQGAESAFCRSFDRNRRGSVVAEGAGAIVLEEWESAKQRGAVVLGEVLGHASSAVRDRQGVAQLDVALENALRQALHNGGLTAEEIGHVHAHGLATRRGDRLEARAIHRVFGHRERPVPVLAAKSYLGNMGAGGGMVELAASLLAAQQAASFPVLGYETPDPECALNIVRDAAVDLGDSLVNLNVTPQGQASCLLVRTAP